MKISPEKLDELIKIVHLAGIEIIKIYKKKVTKKYKSDNTPVTNADIRANDIICKGLKLHFPEISIVSEEQVKKGKATKKFWLVDPLDGTKEFLKGKSNFFKIGMSLLVNIKETDIFKGKILYKDLPLETDVPSGIFQALSLYTNPSVEKNRTEV